jgi:TPR repeat protein/energy-coupling factor transporter ATP-binding protein EcfA2
MANETYDVFISYSRADARHAADIDAALRAHGLRSFFDRRNLAPGAPWIRALEEAIGMAKAAIVLIGPRGLGNTQQYERELAIVRQSHDPGFPVVPVMLPEATTDRPFDFLNVLTWIDFSKVAKPSDAPDEFDRLLAAVRGAPAANEAPREAVCPYRGLDAFREEDAAFFFGRGGASEPDSPIGLLLRKVREQSFVMVVGRSGSGKSSLVYAGLMPALRRERDKFWNVLSLRPGPAPLRALAAAFNPRGDDEGAAEYQTKITREAGNLRTGDPDLLSHMIRDELDRAQGKPDRLLLYIDQWEELYAQAPSSADKQRAAEHAADVNRFIDLLLAASRTAPVAIVASVRADFFDPLIAHQELRSLLPSRQVLLGSMSRSELERTIVEPAKKVGLVFDPPDLVQRILDDAGDDDGMLPLLQYALKETWALRKGAAMTSEAYTRSGGVRGAIRVTAERAFGELSPESQQAARRLFLRLVRPGEGQEDTRARAAMPAEPEQRKIVEQFADPRTRLLVTGSDRERRPTVEVAHEALIRTWPRLREWIDASRERLRAREAVLQAKSDWQKNGERADMLLPPGLPLERARSLLADPGDITTDDLEDFISLSSAREEAERKKAADVHRRQVRNRNFALAGVSCLALLAAWLGWSFRQQLGIAQEQKLQADDILTNATNIITRLQNRFDPETQKEVHAVFQTGALHGDASAMANLGGSYREGFGVAQDYVKAREWYEKAADKGNAWAMGGLGFLFENGHGAPQDYIKAREWYEKAADKGNAVAMTNLGGLYENGRGVAQDFVKAREWYEKAADKGEAVAMSNLGALYEQGRGVAQDYAKAREWYEKAADKGNAGAMRGLGVLYESGLSVAQDYATAREWYERATDSGDAGAMRGIGFLYQNGLGVTKDYAKAREWYEKAADRGDATAMFNLGVLNQQSQGVTQDYAKAREWYEKAADKGEAKAVTNLGTLYEFGQGVAQDYVKARELYEKAADKGEATAMHNLGEFYDNGQGVTQDDAKAREWYEKAADRGDPDAMRLLGAIYENGRGVTQDYVQAREWYGKGADKGDAVAMRDLGLLYDDGHGVAQDYAKAREWYEKAAANGDATAMTNLGALYANGRRGVPQDYATAREWYEKAADRGNAVAMFNLGVLYDNGQDVAQDFAKARVWFEQAADKGHATAMYNLGVLYGNGQGVAQDYAKAREWYEKAADRGEATAMTNLGALFENGQGVAPDYAKARQWFERAADKGEPIAMRDLGAIYYNGYGVPQDPAKAREWFEKASDKGDADAKAIVEALSIREAEGAGRYPEALRLQEVLAAKKEATETQREGKPGRETGQALGEVAWYALLAQDFDEALSAANRAHALVPDDLGIEINRAHALMFSGRAEDAEALYLAHKGEPMSADDSRPWERVIAKEFADLRNASLSRPMMDDIEQKLGVSH